ncbi:MAG TPA: hypothetical protein VF435_03895 [Pyrinomonadaceae bacterium]
MPNWERYDAVLAHIEKHPEEWDQQHFCGSACCFAGHVVQMFSSQRPLEKRVPYVGYNAMDLLKLTNNEACWLFDPDRTIADFHAFRAAGGIPT